MAIDRLKFHTDDADSPEQAAAHIAIFLEWGIVWLDFSIFTDTQHPFGAITFNVMYGDDRICVLTISI